MDIDITESTFNELMGELEKIKDLNELAESYKKKTQVLSEQLERFLSASAEGRNIVMEKIQSVEDALKTIMIINSPNFEMLLRNIRRQQINLVLIYNIAKYV